MCCPENNKNKSKNLKIKYSFIKFFVRYFGRIFPKISKKLLKWKIELNINENPEAYMELQRVFNEFVCKIKDSPYCFDEKEKKDFRLQLFIQYTFRYLILEYSRKEISVSNLEKEVVKNLPTELYYEITTIDSNREFLYMIENKYIQVVINNDSLSESTVCITKKGQKIYDEHTFVNLASNFYYAYSESESIKKSLEISENTMKSTKTMLIITVATLIISIVAIVLSVYQSFFYKNKDNEVITNKMIEIQKQIKNIIIPSKIETTTNDTIKVLIINDSKIK